MNGVARAALDGALAGAGATTLMTGFMKGSQWAGYYQDEIPPEKITKRSLWRAGASEAVDEEAEQVILTGLGHWAFGMVGGGIFGVLHKLLPVPVPATLHGLVFGLLVWYVSYKGWIPATGLIAPPERQPREIARMPLYAHVVYGSTLGALFSSAQRRR
jgi:hypothetical protein